MRFVPTPLTLMVLSCLNSHPNPSRDRAQSVNDLRPGTAPVMRHPEGQPSRHLTVLTHLTSFLDSFSHTSHHLDTRSWILFAIFTPRSLDDLASPPPRSQIGLLRIIAAEDPRSNLHPSSTSISPSHHCEVYINVCALTGLIHCSKAERRDC